MLPQWVFRLIGVIGFGGLLSRGVVVVFAVWLLVAYAIRFPRSRFKDDLTVALWGGPPLLVGCCESACKKDPLLGVIGIQSGPPNRRVHIGFHDSWGPDWNVGRGDDCEDSPSVFCTREG